MSFEWFCSLQSVQRLCGLLRWDRARKRVLLQLHVFLAHAVQTARFPIVGAALPPRNALWVGRPATLELCIVHTARRIAVFNVDVLDPLRQRHAASLARSIPSLARSTPRDPSGGRTPHGWRSGRMPHGWRRWRGHGWRSGCGLDAHCGTMYFSRDAHSARRKADARAQEILL